MGFMDSIMKPERKEFHDVVPCMATCCQVQACWCAFPQCCSILREGECLCFRFLMKGSLNSEPLGEREMFMFGADGRVAIVTPVTCCKGKGQACCADTYYACPCDNDMPAICACCFFTCCVNYKPVFAFEKTIGESMAIAGGGSAPVSGGGVEGEKMEIRA